jgi:isopenicillin N synthase-like dioxygenase
MQFFALPTAEKMKLDASKHPFNRGYIRPGGVNPGANPDKTADIKERFAMCREYYPGEPAGDGSTRAGLSQWPAPGVLPGFEDFLKTHIEKRVAIARHLLHALALGLDLPETYFDAAHHYPSFMHFYNYYPPCPTNGIFHPIPIMECSPSCHRMTMAASRCVIRRAAG